jgi:uncharacterized RDD family membrane protein YckC
MELIGDGSKARIAAFIIDNLIACFLSVLAVGLIHSPNSIVSGGLLALVYLGYFFLFETFWSRTPGKFLQGLVIRQTDGSHCHMKHHLIRTLARIVEANPILLGGLPAGLAIFASARKQRIGDSLAGTVVIARRSTFD